MSVPGRSLHIPQSNELKQWFSVSGLSLVIFVFSVLVFLNLLTLAVGTQRVYDVLNLNPQTAFLSFIIYDSAGTIGGLVGVAAIFSVLSLFTFLITGRTPKSRAITFVMTSLVIGIASQLVWNSCCNTGNTFPAGSSAIDFAALASLIVYSATDSVRLLRIDVDRKSRLWSDSRLTALYFVLVAAMLLLFALSIQPIYVPTDRYNWQVHEYAFVSTCVVTFFTEVLGHG